ncbi:MAG: DUF362 domain-containing protein [Thermoanaerobaculaceae bacterium]|nr:DUF362 domain-containing protein [Thermoanaerobaculaceae bacterium]MDI9622198.1 DUF362 domain-containing protein [Acidobacteriota bacterium]NLH12609.1 DUF362 domain-containing protein [Holophagae bacterium]HPW54921.1 DUF362 domain-containing protein [Thermoanaerobaculaceae bacterium]
MREPLSRRELLAVVSAGVVGAVGTGAAPVRRGKVGLARLPATAVGADMTTAQAREALERALVAATGASSGAAAAKQLFAPGDTVGIKVNTLGGPRLSPRPALVEALAALLRDAGVGSERIIVFDRSSRELQRAGYTIRRSGEPFLCFGIDNDYDRQPASHGAIGSCFARLVSATCTALVSLGVVKDHDLAGVSAGLKNWFGVIHNPNKYHDGNCNPYVADVVSHPYVRSKLRLTVLDAGTAQCHGGPAYRPDMAWPLGMVAASTDPVAIDAWAWKVIDEERTRRGLPRLAEAQRPPSFVATAARYGLGVGDPAAVREVLA